MLGVAATPSTCSLPVRRAAVADLAAGPFADVAVLAVAGAAVGASSPELVESASVSREPELPG